MTDILKNQPIPMEIKKSVAIVLIGNFLDFFDLMVAVHLTLVLTKVFLPIGSAATPLLTIFAFCSSFCIRPLAAFFWGYIGDMVGRVPVLISATFLMSISCILIPNIPPYAEWGMLSAILFLSLRLVQGFASGGECIAADVFITETVPKPMVYFCSALVEATCSLGGLVACGIGALCMAFSPEDGWKLPFYIGSAVAVVGTIARKTLKETPEFIKTLQERKSKKNPTNLFLSLTYKNRNIPALFAMYLFPAVSFYFSLAYIPSLLMNQFGIEAHKVMAQTTLVLFIVMCSEISYGILGVKIHPFKILKFKLYSLIFIMPFLMYFSSGLYNTTSIFVVQLIVACLGQGLTPASPIFNKSFPVFGRYTYLLFIWAFSHSLMYLLTAYVCEKISNFQLLCLLLFIAAIISLIGVYVFVPREKMITQQSNTPQVQEEKNDPFNENSGDLDLLDEKQKNYLVKNWMKKFL